MIKTLAWWISTYTVYESVSPYSLMNAVSVVSNKDISHNNMTSIGSSIYFHLQGIILNSCHVQLYVCALYQLFALILTFWVNFLQDLSKTNPLLLRCQENMLDKAYSAIKAIGSPCMEFTSGLLQVEDWWMWLSQYIPSKKMFIRHGWI